MLPLVRKASCPCWPHPLLTSIRQQRVVTPPRTPIASRGWSRHKLLEFEGNSRCPPNRGHRRAMSWFTSWFILHDTESLCGSLPSSVFETFSFFFFFFFTACVRWRVASLLAKKPSAFLFVFQMTSVQFLWTPVVRIAEEFFFSSVVVEV